MISGEKNELKIHVNQQDFVTEKQAPSHSNDFFVFCSWEMKMRNRREWEIEKKTTINYEIRNFL